MIAFAFKDLEQVVLRAGEESASLAHVYKRLTDACGAVLPELDREGWTSDDFVRDMPVDYTLLVENLLDPGGQCKPCLL